MIKKFPLLEKHHEILATTTYSETTLMEKLVIPTRFIIIILIILNAFTQQVSAQPTVGFSEKITGLSQPLDFVNAGDLSNRIFIVEQGGTIDVFSSTFTSLNPLPYLTVTGIVTGGEQGLLSLAFHPNFETNGFFWVYYTNAAGDLEIARYHADPLLNVAEPLTKQVVLTIAHIGANNHNGGKLIFGSDGFLYLATGDGGGAGDPDNSAQLGDNLLGKMLRIDVGIGEPATYTSPASNPFANLAGDPTSSIMDEIFSFGLRNPFRWSFDVSGNMWIGDVGQGALEEINRVTNASGLNFGWRCYEGTAVYNNAGCASPMSYTYPVYEYPNPSMSQAAVTGGMVYRGTTYPELQGWYYAADVYSGDIHFINSTSLVGGTPQTNVLDLISGFGETENGELFVVSLDGSAYQLLPASALPVELVDFKVDVLNNVASLSWKTLMEQNAQQFEIEYGNDGARFTRIGIVAATNNPNGSMYQFQHRITGNERNAFYRLKMLDLDGSFTYSNIVRLQLKSRENNFVQPSVVTNGVINLFITESYDQLRIINSQGAVIKSQPLNGRTGSVPIPVHSIAKGAYIIQLLGSDKILSQKVIIR